MTRYLMISGVALFFISCSAKKILVRVDKVDLETVLDGMNRNNRDFTWFSGKARVKFEGSEFNMGGRCNIRMIKDSLIWMNFKKLSIEGSRVLITRDSFWIVYRIDKMYESGTLKELMDAYSLDLNFDELQAFVIGNYPIPDRSEVRRFKSDNYHEFDFTENDRDYSYKVDNRYLLNEIYLKDTLQRQITGRLLEYDDQSIALSKEFNVDLEDGSHGKISFSFSDIEIDKPKSIQFDIPAHYRRLP